MVTTRYFYTAFKEARTRLTLVIDRLQPEDVLKRLEPCPNSVGFLLRHIGDVELLFAKNVFKNEEVQVRAKTLIDQKDSGEWTDLADLKNYVQTSFEILVHTIAQQDDDSWDEELSTKEFGTKTKAEALGRIISHTAYHAGQLAIVQKYGK